MRTNRKDWRLLAHLVAGVVLLVPPALVVQGERGLADLYVAGASPEVMLGATMGLFEQVTSVLGPCIVGALAIEFAALFGQPRLSRGS